MNRTRLTTLCLLFGAAGTLFACGGDDDDGGTNDDLSLEERIFGGIGANFAEQQQLIRECMVAEGFDYTPRDDRAAEGGPDRPDSNDEEFIEQYGFGISTMFASEIKFSPADDPNFEYRNGLSESQQKAYDIALYGQEMGGDAGFVKSGGGVAIPIGGEVSADGDTVRAKAPGGCLGKALEATGGGPRDFDSSLFDEFEEMEDRIMADPKMVEAISKWSTCMADSGYDYQDLEEPQEEIREEFSALTGLELADGGRFSVTISAEDGDGEPNKSFDPFANVDPEKLSELQAKEKRIARDAWDCVTKVGGWEIEREVRQHYEEQFLEDHPELKDR